MKPQLTADGSFTLHSNDFGETYHSRHGAATESRHIYLEGTGVLKRLQNKQSCAILEIGFGTALNFLLTADMAIKHDSGLNYTAIEKKPISKALFKQLGYKSLLCSPDLCDLVCHSLDRPTGEQQLNQGKIHLTTIIEDVTEASWTDAVFDAVYLDAFSPNSNTECWSDAMLYRYFHALKPGGSLATYSVQGNLRRQMSHVGFQTEKYPGPPGKREFLVAFRPHCENKPPIDTDKNK